MIELKDLSIGYSSGREVREIFTGLSVRLAAGELAGLVGNNGVGKSTLIKTIFGALTPLKGEVLLNGKNIHQLSLQEIAKTISIVMTEKIGGFNLTVADVVASGRSPYTDAFGRLTKNDLEIVEESLEQIGITELRERRVDELSDGQRQKVMIAKSLAQQTPVILLDEPTAFLDHTSRQQLFRMLKELCKEKNKCILVSSHDLEILFRNADKALHLKKDGSFEFDAPSQLKIG